MDTKKTSKIGDIENKQFVSLSEKMKPKWYMAMADYVIDKCKKNNDKVLIKELFDLANGYIKEEKYNYLISSLVENDKAEQNMPVRVVDLIAPIKDRYMGEFGKSYHSYQCYSLDMDSIALRNKELKESVTALAVQKLINILNQEGMETGQPSQEVEDIDKFIEKFKKEWKDKRVIDAQQRLELINATVEAQDKYYTMYYHWWATRCCYSYREVIDDEFYFYAISPLEYYRCASGNKFVEDDDMGVWETTISVNQLVDWCRTFFTKEQIEEIVKLTQYVEADGSWRVPVRLIEKICGGSIRQLDFDTDYILPIHETEDTVLLTNNSKKIVVARYAYKTPTPVKLLTYISLDGEVREMIVSDDYQLDPYYGDISIRTEYHNKVFMGLRIGNESNAIYSEPRLAECQRELLGNESVTKLPFNGMSWMVAESKRDPIPKRLEPYSILYTIYTTQIERASSKFKDWIILPESALNDSEYMTMSEKLQAARNGGLLVLSDSEIDDLANVLQAIREVYTQGIERYINTLNGIKQQIKQEAWEQANMNDARAGQLGQYAGKATTEYALNLAQTGSTWELQQFNTFREKDLLANFDWSKVAWSKGKSGSYIDHNTNQAVYVDVDGVSGLGTNIGISVQHASKLEEKKNQLKEIGFAAAQNGDTMTAVEIVMHDNPNQLAEILRQGDEAKKSYELSLQTAASKANEKLEVLKDQLADKESKRKIDEIMAKVNAETEARIRVAEINKEALLESTAMKVSHDSNGDGYIDNYDTQEDKTMKAIMNQNSNTASAVAGIPKV